MVLSTISTRNARMLGNNPVDKVLRIVGGGNLIIYAVPTVEFGVLAGFHVVAEARTPGIVHTAFFVGAQ